MARAPLFAVVGLMASLGASPAPADPAGAAPPLDLRRARAHWLAADTVAWPAPAEVTEARAAGAPVSFALHASEEGTLRVEGGAVVGGRDIPLAVASGSLPRALRERFPHLAACVVLRLPKGSRAEVPRLLQGQVAFSVRVGDRLVEATGLQVAGVLDDLFRYEGPLGVTMAGPFPTLRVWAPTARAVRLHLFGTPRGGEARVLPLKEEARGVWSAVGETSWMGAWYLYEVEVFVPETGGFERNLVTDPWSVSVSRNGERSQVVDLDSLALKPLGWDRLPKPPLERLEDVVLYELHVRDFSASDPTVPEPLRGTFRAFTLEDSLGIRHLRRLAGAGLTHVHLLPAFDFATVDEDRATWLAPAGEALAGPPEAEAQQAAVVAVASRDGFNWGYDPLHSTVPEGSYATDPDGPARIREFRFMVAALARAGLRVVMDVVYNHTHASGQDPLSVLDRIVPGYYHRLDAEGRVERSTCCANTASEHAMMERLIVDSVRTWAREYKVDGFRFDLMGHHMKRNLLAVRAALDALTPERDGVDGRKVYVYGEGWDFGEVAGNARGVNATQLNLAGTGIGTFNDRIRDGARGGSAFGPLREQGFLTGLLDAPNPVEKRPEAERRVLLLTLQDRVRIGLAGNLSELPLVAHDGRTVKGREVDYRGQPTAYAASPRESVNYVEAHDNETLFDAIQLKVPPSLPMAEKVRMQNLGVSLVGLGQGIPFFHAGVELLRSKSMDRNSFDSGDWFNRLDLTGQSNNWGVGLPPERENGANWPVMRALLADPALRPSPADIERALAHFLEVLRVRRSSPLFRLDSAEAVARHLRFHGAGAGTLPGVIAFSLSDPEGAVDAAHRLVVVVLNASAAPVTLRDGDLAVPGLVLHPVQRASDDPVLRGASVDAGAGAVTVPGRTAAVFWTEG